MGQSLWFIKAGQGVRAERHQPVLSGKLHNLYRSKEAVEWVLLERFPLYGGPH